MSAFGTNTRQRRFCHSSIVSSTSFYRKQSQTFVRHCFSSSMSWICRVSQMFPCMPKDILVSNVTQNYKTNKFSCSTQIIKFIWLILSTINYNSDITLFLILRSSQGSEATHCRCGGKYDTDLVANLLLSPTLKNFF